MTKEIVLLLTGAGGALIAIFLKEAMQQAFQRRVVTWQLIGYLVAFKAFLLRDEKTRRLYSQILDRESHLHDSLSKGAAAFEAKLQEQKQQQGEMREALRTGIQDLVTEKLMELDEPALQLLDELAEAAAQRRSLLLDAKTFLSDKDAAVLGAAVAINVVQFRSAFGDMLDAFEGLFKAAKLNNTHRPKITAHLVDQIVLHGHEALTVFSRLERRVETLSTQSLPRLLWSVVTGR